MGYVERRVARYCPSIRAAEHSFDRDTYHLGRGTRQLSGDIEIGLYGQERTIIDAFRMRHELGTDIAYEALKRWLRRRGSNPGELLTMANHFPKAGPALRSALEILL